VNAYVAWVGVGLYRLGCMGLGWWLYGMDCLGCCEKKKKSFRDGAMAAHLMVVNTKLKWRLVDCRWVGLDMYVCSQKR